MPGFVAFNRRWGVGSDDFVFPGFAEIFIRTIWLVAVAVVYTKQKDGFVCGYGYLLHSYCIGMMVVLVLHIILSVMMTIISSRGTMIHIHPRRYLHIILYSKLLMFLPELAITLLGTIWAFDLEDNCDRTVVFAMRATAVAGWFILICLVIGVVVVFDPVGGKKPHSDNLLRMEQQQRLWSARCRVLCCCAAHDEHSANAFNEISHLITDFFKGMDVVATDIAAGLLLIQMEQKHKPKRLHLELLTKQNEPQAVTPSRSNQEDLKFMVNVPATIDSVNDDPAFPRPQSWMTIQQAAHYMKFASASYGWALYMYSNLCHCLSAYKLCTACRCCACVRAPDSIMDDNCCGCNTAAIVRTTGINENDIIYASYYNRIYQIPFFVALDHREKAVVLSVRGTLSLRDAITDLTVDSELLDTPGVDGGYAHKGILQAAQFIHTTITNLQLLEKAFQEAPGYQLIITGHSLGAGAASILAILLRSQYPQLKCFAFSPPGWLISLPLARYTEEFIYSVVLANDLVPRLGFINMEKLKTEILTAIHHTNKPKYKILSGGVWNVLKDVFRTPTQDVTTDRTSLMRASPPRSYTEEYIHNDDPEVRVGGSGRSTLDIENPLYMPGHVLYIEEIQPRKMCCGEALYRPAWARPEAFDEILVSPKMIRDHLPNVVSQALDQLSASESQPCHQAHTSHNETAVI